MCNEEQPNIHWPSKHCIYTSAHTSTSLFATVSFLHHLRTSWLLLKPKSMNMTRKNKKALPAVSLTWSKPGIAEKQDS